MLYTNYALNVRLAFIMIQSLAEPVITLSYSIEFDLA